MRDRDLSRQCDLITNLIDEAGSLASQNSFLASHLSGYICIRISGFFENAVSAVIYSYAKDRAHRYIVAYVERSVSRLTNISADKLGKAIGALSPVLRQQLDLYLEESGNKDALDSLINIRNTIAHGKDHGVTVAQAKSYFKQCKDIISFLKELMPPKED